MKNPSYAERQARREEDRYLERQCQILKSKLARSEQAVAEDRLRLAGLGLVSDKDRTTAANRMMDEADAMKRQLERLAEARWGVGAQSPATPPHNARTSPAAPVAHRNAAPQRSATVPPAANNGARTFRSKRLNQLSQEINALMRG